MFLVYYCISIVSEGPFAFSVYQAQLDRLQPQASAAAAQLTSTSAYSSFLFTVRMRSYICRRKKNLA